MLWESARAVGRKGAAVLDGSDAETGKDGIRGLRMERKDCDFER